MLFNQHFVSGLLASMALVGSQPQGVSATSTMEAKRELTSHTPCATLDACYLWDKTAKKEIKLTGNDSYCPSDSTRGWSVRCDANYPEDEDCDGNPVTSTLDEIKFTYDGKVHDEYGEPRWMNGDSDPTSEDTNRWINDVAYLAKAGTKEFSIEGRQWARSCFKKEFTLTEKCAAAPKSAPKSAPQCVEMATDKAYKVVAKHSGLSVHVAGESIEKGKAIAQSKAGEGWLLTATEDNYYTVVGANSGLGWIVHRRSRQAGEGIISWPVSISQDTSDNWCFTALCDGTYGIINRKSQMALTVESSSKATGTKLVQEPNTQAPNQSFELEEVEVPPQMTMCARAAFKMHYAPNVPTTWKLEGINPDKEFMELDVQGDSPRTLTWGEQHWWHLFSTHYLKAYETKLRFVSDKGVAGPWNVCKKNSPIGLDIDGSGAVEHIEGKFTIDITGDGDIETLNEWFAPTEGILIDVTHGIEGGIITGHHLFGDMGGDFSDGFAKLTMHDDDKDGFVSGDELDGFAVWTDANSNAKLDEGELSSLADHNVVSLSTSHKSLVSSATLSDGSTMYVEDLWFAR